MARDIVSFPQWPYGEKQVIVMTRRGLQLPTSLRGRVEVSSEPIDLLLQRLKARGVKNAYIDGGKLIQSFLQSRQLSEMTITRIPILLGEGLPLFGTLGNDVSLKLIKSQFWTFGFAQDQYEIL